MSKKEMEKNLSYGDCNNLFCFFRDVLESTLQSVEKSIDLIVKKD